MRWGLSTAGCLSTQAIPREASRRHRISGQSSWRKKGEHFILLFSLLVDESSLHGELTSLNLHCVLNQLF